MSKRLGTQDLPAFSNVQNAREISRSVGGRRFQDADCAHPARKNKTVILIYRDKERE